MSEKITVIFITPEGNKIECETQTGLTILDVAHSNKDKFFLEGACEGSLACSTCHVILEEDECSAFPPAEDDEEDLLDLAFGLTKTSRLGCQLTLTPEMNGFSFKLPAHSRNIKM